MEWLIAIPVLVGLGGFLVLIVMVSIGMVADLLTGSRPRSGQPQTRSRPRSSTRAEWVSSPTAT